MYRFTYAIVLPTDSVLRPGDYFTIYDFDGFVAGSEMASGSPYSTDWSFTADHHRPDARRASCRRTTPAIPNLSWTYTGAEINIDASIGLGNFWALSLYPDTTDSWFTASTGTTAGETDNNITPTMVPVPTAPAPRRRRVPNRPRWLWPGWDLPLVGLARWVRRRSR